MPARRPSSPSEMPPQNFDSEHFQKITNWLKVEYPDLSTDALVTNAVKLYELTAKPSDNSSYPL